MISGWTGQASARRLQAEGGPAGGVVALRRVVSQSAAGGRTMDPAPGWYPSPTSSGLEQWFDGISWTGYFKPGQQSSSGTIIGIVFAAIFATIVVGSVLVTVLFMIAMGHNEP